MKPLHRVHEHEETDTEGSWAISYGDMITLLLAFFILFFTIDPQKDKAKQMQAAVLLSLDSKAKNINHEEGHDDTIRAGDKKEVGMDESLLKKWHGVAHQVGNKILVEFTGVSFFNSAEIRLTPEGEKALSEFVKVFMPYAGNYTIGIRAFTDMKRVRKMPNRRFHDNLELSAFRSIATMRALQHDGIPMSQITLGGYGELQLTADDLHRLPASANRNDFDLARKIVLVLQQSGRDAL